MCSVIPDGSTIDPSFYMPRIRIPWDDVGVVFITSSLFECQKHFANSETASLFIDILHEYGKRAHYTIDTYCVMPDHYHAILRFAKKTSLSRVLNSIHSYVVERTKNGKRKPRIWSGRTWDEWMRSEDMYWQKVAYILMNPWRAGLVSHPLDSYPFSDIDEWRKRKGDEFLLDLFSQHLRQNEQW